MQCISVPVLKSIGLALACSLALTLRSADKEPAEMAKSSDINKTQKADEVKDRLKDVPKTHPRLFLKTEDEEKLKAMIASDPLLKSSLDHVKSLSDAMIPLPVLERIQIGRRLLDVSRASQRRIAYLSLAYRMTKDRRYLDRAQKEMLACAAFTDWNPSHFLDVAEMTGALALGYDWLYNDLDPEARRTIRMAIVEKGLRQGQKVKGGWVTGTSNWNQVCHGGLTLAALAVLEDEPELASELLVRAVECVPNSMREYAPDGAYPEGPTYWGYGTSYNVLMLAALESVLGSDFGLCETKGFLDTPEFLINVAGPTRLFFNYSDCSANGGVEPAMYWFALKKNEPGLLVVEKERLKKYLAGKHRPEGAGNRFFPFMLLWAKPFAEMKPPSEFSWKGGGHTPLGIHRSGWDENATFVAMKGGSPSTSHAHMDIGSFVMDADGVRWAEDLGMQGYESLESKGVGLWKNAQDGGRWTVFRLNNRGHNTLVVDDNLQIVTNSLII
ncbi:MAG TPA: hypothetical protein DCZ94_08410, partial [Lentisphaeria bacterium]|nr:hypothetical protein [Lentisphaeria bacterium]